MVLCNPSFVLFCFVLFCFVLFCVVFCFVLFRFVLFCFSKALFSSLFILFYFFVGSSSIFNAKNVISDILIFEILQGTMGGAFVAEPMTRGCAL